MADELTFGYFADAWLVIGRSGTGQHSPHSDPAHSLTGDFTKRDGTKTDTYWPE